MQKARKYNSGEKKKDSEVIQIIQLFVQKGIVIICHIVKKVVVKKQRKKIGKNRKLSIYVKQRHKDKKENNEIKIKSEIKKKQWD